MNMINTLQEINTILQESKKPIEQKILDYISISQGTLEDAFKEVFVFYKQLQDNIQSLGRITRYLFKMYQQKYQQQYLHEETIQNLCQQIIDLKRNFSITNGQANMLYEKIENHQRHIDFLLGQKQALQDQIIKYKIIIQKLQKQNQQQKNAHNIDDLNHLGEEQNLKMTNDRLRQENKNLYDSYLQSQNQYEKLKFGTDFLYDELNIIKENYKQLKSQNQQLLEEVEGKQIMIISFLKDKEELEVAKSNSHISSYNQSHSPQKIELFNGQCNYKQMPLNSRIQELSEENSINHQIQRQTLKEYQFQIYKSFQKDQLQNECQILKNEQRLLTQETQTDQTEQIKPRFFNTLKGQLNNVDFGLEQNQEGFFEKYQTVQIIEEHDQSQQTSFVQNKVVQNRNEDIVIIKSSINEILKEKLNYEEDQFQIEGIQKLNSKSTGLLQQPIKKELNTTEHNPENNDKIKSLKESDNEQRLDQDEPSRLKTPFKKNRSSIKSSSKKSESKIKQNKSSSKISKKSQANKTQFKNIFQNFFEKIQRVIAFSVKNRIDQSMKRQKNQILMKNRVL